MHKKKSSNAENDGKYSESNNKESSPYAKKKRASRCHESEWFDCGLTDIENLPYDIDDICIYQLKFGMTQRMTWALSEPWKTWVTWCRKVFSGIWRKASSLESFQCVNENCAFFKYYGKQKRLHLNPTNQACSACGQERHYNEYRFADVAFKRFPCFFLPYLYVFMLVF